MIVQTPYTNVNPELQANHAAVVKHTERHANGKEHVRRHNLRLSTMIALIKDNYPEYSDEMIIELPLERKQEKCFTKLLMTLYMISCMQILSKTL